MVWCFLTARQVLYHQATVSAPHNHIFNIIQTICSADIPKGDLNSSLKFVSTMVLDSCLLLCVLSP